MKKDSVIVLRASIFTIIPILVILVITYFSMLFFVPAKLGDFFYNLGCENIAGSLYYREYEKNDDIYYVYKSLTIEIKQKDNSNIIKYYEIFVEDDEFNDFTNALIERNENLNLGILEKSIKLDELNTINCNYVKALYEINEKEKSVNFALSDFILLDDITLINIGNYSLSYVIEDLKDDSNLAIKVDNYFKKLINVFNNTTPSGDLDKSYLLRLGNRIMTVGSDYLKICDDIEKDPCVQNMKNVNTKIMELMR